MYIKYVKIWNFRGIQKGHINFQKGVNILIGSNNVGKSTILKAIDLVLNPYISWWRRDNLSELDFFNLDTNNPIEIEVLMGCGRLKCIDDEENCPYFEYESNGKSETCRFTEKSVIWDNALNKFLNVDEISDDDDTNKENCIRLLMQAEFQDTEGFVETKHMILNENREEWARLNQPMKEWIGSKPLSSDRNPINEGRLQYNSLLSKVIGNIAEWRKKCGDSFRSALEPIVKELAQKYAKGITEEIDRRIRKLDRLSLEGKTDIGIQGANASDIIRQVELSRRFSFGEDGDQKEWELPFSRQGRGFQNITSLILGAYSYKEVAIGSSNSSILLIEEPEQNLEPPLQRSIIKDVEKICGDESQIILSTHSPYILSSTLNLKGIKRLKKDNKGNLLSKPLDEIKVNNKKDFFKIRQNVAHDIELMEALFSSLIILWEGDCETGFYQGLMRLEEDFPSEMLAGVNAGKGGIINLALWLKKAGYEVFTVLDGDNIETLENLSKNDIPFIALPQGKKIENVISEQLEKIDKTIAVEALLKSIGASGDINWRNDFRSKWPALAQVFKNKNKERDVIETEVAINEIADCTESSDCTPMPEDILNILVKYKERSVYENLARFFHEKESVPFICQEIVKLLKDIWFKSQKPGFWQINENGNIEPYFGDSEL